MDSKFKSDIQQLLQYTNTTQIDKALDLIATYAENIPSDKLDCLRLAQLSLELGGMSYSVKILKKLSDKEPEDLKLKYHLATAYLFCNDYENAKQIFELNKGKFDSNAGALNTVASCYSGLGEFDEAERLFRKALELNPTLGIAAHGLSKCRKFEKDDYPLLEQLEKAKPNAKDNDSLIKLNKAIAKIYNDLKEYDKAWEAAKEANDLFNSLSPFPGLDIPAKRLEVVEKYKEKFNTSTSEEEHLLIVGMPRSGTTLTEQIISSHPSYQQSGESPSLEFSIQYGLHNSIFENSINASVEQLNKAAEGYSFYYSQLGAAKGKRIINKVPANYMNIGFFKQMFSKGKVIFLQRDYRDVTASIFFEHFSSPQSFTNKVDDIIATYKFALSAIEKWKQVFADDIYILKYEDLVNDKEQCLHNISEFLGIKKDDILGNENNKSAVNTPSLWQVRQGVYKTSKSRYLRYSALKDLPELNES